MKRNMQKIKKLLSILLCASILITCLTFPTHAITYPMMGEIASSNGKALIYSLAGTTGHEAKPEDKNKSQFLCELLNDVQIKVLGETVDGDGDKWYQINYGENYASTGYAIANKVVLKYEYEFDADFEKNLQNFPESYRESLRALHAKYPNWKFVANKFDLSFKEAVEAQYGVAKVEDTRKWVELTYGGNEWRDMRAFNSTTNQWKTLEGSWTYASRAAIEYYMDPRNSLDENKIFAFMQQSYSEDPKMQENLKTVIKGTFLEKGYDKNGDGSIEANAYIEDLIEAAKQSRVSPYVLAATIIVEQGAEGKTNLVSGNYPGYQGYYNFFNFAASGSSIDDITKSGLDYAKKSGWNSRSAAIIGGTKNYADGYILVGQDTYYYKDFNVVKEIWNHQYASALYDAWTNAQYLKKGCVTSTDAVITFSIPVFTDMPQNAAPLPTANSSTDNGQGNSPSGNGSQSSPSNSSTPSTSASSSKPVSTTSSTVTQPTPSKPQSVVKKGDTNNDGKINAVDLAAVKMHILGVKKLDGTAATAANVNGDGVINAVDLAAVKMHILGVKTIV